MYISIPIAFNPPTLCSLLCCVVRCAEAGVEGLTSLFHRVSVLATHVMRLGHVDRVTSCSILQAFNLSINQYLGKTPQVEEEPNFDAW